MAEIFLTYILGFFGAIGFETPSPTTDAPRITFIYFPALDKYVCPTFDIFPWSGKVQKLPVPLADFQRDLDIHLPRLQSLWNLRGPVLFKTASELLNTKFGYQSDFTKVVLCPAMPSWPVPRIISVSKFMPSMPPEQRWNSFEFVDVVFHEHLHMLVYRLLNWKLDTPLLKKYQQEELLTKAHLHLYAVTKAVYFRLEMQKEWQQIATRAKSFDPVYQRAVTIVENEGFEPFLNELKPIH